LIDSFHVDKNVDVVVEVKRDVFTINEYKPKEINNFELFISECCETGDILDCSYTTIKNQYKIWSKTPNTTQLKNLINYLKTKFQTTSKRHNPLVNTSKKTNYFKKISIKKEFYEFVKPISDYHIIESFLYEKCQRAPGFRVSMIDFFTEFERFYTKKFIYVIKEQVKNYCDVLFIRLRTGDESRLGGWLGVALQTCNVPEPILKYKPKEFNK
jgi:hypothetical protein